MTKQQVKDHIQNRIDSIQKMINTNEQKIKKTEDIIRMFSDGLMVLHAKQDKYMNIMKALEEGIDLLDENKW